MLGVKQDQYIDVLIYIYGKTMKKLPRRVYSDEPKRFEKDGIIVSITKDNTVEIYPKDQKEKALLVSTTFTTVCSFLEEINDCTKIASKRR